MGEPIVAIVNPASSHGRTLRRWPALHEAIAASLPGITVRMTEAPGHATLLCRRALEDGARMVVSIGGDGTNNEVLSGFVDDTGRNRFPDAELGLVHSGTGGDFLRHLGRPSLAQAIAAVAVGPAVQVDYGVATFIDHQGHEAVRPFLNVASAGLSGLVDHHVRRSSRWIGQTATYVLGSLRALLEYRAKWVEIAIDDAEPVELPLMLVVAANGQYFGGGMWIAPVARCDDGRFDVLHAPHRSRFATTGLLGRVFAGKHVDDPSVVSTGGRVCSVRPRDRDDVVLVDLDGEQPGRLPATFRIVPGGLRVRAAGAPGPARTRS